MIVGRKTIVPNKGLSIIRDGPEGGKGWGRAFGNFRGTNFFFLSFRLCIILSMVNN